MSWAQAIEDVAARFDHAHTPGAMIAAVSASGIHACGTYGRANAEHDVAWSLDNPVRIASITKQFAAAAAVRLAESGIIDLDRSIRHHLAHLPAHFDPVTLRHLLANQGGVANDESLAWLCGTGTASPADLVFLDRLICRHPRLQFRPGHGYQYSDAGFRLAVHALEAATGEDMDDLTKRLLFAPAGMANSRYIIDGDTIIPNFAATYFAEGNCYRRYLGMMQSTGDGGIVSTMNDMIRWAQYLLSGGREMLDSLGSSPALSGDGYSAYGLGMENQWHRGRHWFTHTGTYHAYSVIALCPEEDVAIICLGNRSDLSVGTLPFRIYDRARPEARTSGSPDAFYAFRAPEESGNDITDTELEALCGVYLCSRTALIAELASKGNVLRFSIGDAVAYLRRGEDGGFRTAFGTISPTVRCSHEALIVNLGLDTPLRFVRAQPHQPTADELEPLVGTYACRAIPAMLEIEAADGQALLIIAGGATPERRLPLDRLTDDIWQGGPLSFAVVERDKHGRAWRLSLNEGAAWGVAYTRVDPHDAIGPVGATNAVLSPADRSS